MPRLLLLACALMAALASLPSFAAQQPNVVFILADDLGYGDLGAHGNPRLKTPNLDKLRDQSARFTDFHVSPMCTPTRGELMTGISAYRNGAVSIGFGATMPRIELPLMPQFFKDSGYATAHFGKWHLGDNYPYRAHDRGFDLSIGYKGFGIDSVAGEPENDAFDDRYWRNSNLTTIKGYNTDVFFRGSMHWMREQQRKKKPFFVYLATTASHEPYYVASRYAKPYEDLRNGLPAFFGMTANLDENMGRLMLFLQRNKLADNTIVIYMTDNGSGERTGFYNAGMRGRKTSLYDGGHRVPFFVRWPAGGVGARDIDALTHSTDLLPTLVEMAQLKPRRISPVDGLSLKPLLLGNTESLGAPDSTFAERKAVIQYGYRSTEFRPWDSAILWGKWRLVNGTELYNVGNDLAQATDVAAQHPDVVQTLRTHYETWAAAAQALPPSVPHIVVGSAAEPSTQLTAADWVGPYAGDLGVLGKTQLPLFGMWNIAVGTTANYTVSLALFPSDAKVPLQQGWRNIPARAVATARLLVDGIAHDLPITATDTQALFKLLMTQGDQHRIEGQFLDAADKPLCGAFFVRISKL
jgi:arylsulfatase A-like enzyme